MIEVEFKFTIPDVMKFKIALAKLGAAKKGIWHEDDTYFSPSHRDFWKTVECLRIRKLSGDRNEAILTYKPPSSTENSGHGFFHKEEIEMTMDSEGAEQLKNVFGFLDIKAIIEIKKLREMFSLGDIEICLDNVERLGIFAEASAFVKCKEEVEDAKVRLFSLIETLGIPKSCLVNEPYRHMMLRVLGKI